MQKDERPNQGIPDEDDLLLVERVLAGDRRAFEPLVRRYERRVFRVTLAVLGNIEDAEDAMQDTFVKGLPPPRPLPKRRALHHLADANRHKRSNSETKHAEEPRTAG